MSQKEVIKFLKDLKSDILIQYKAELVGLFGSFARNDFQNNSDIDILVDFQKGATLLDLSGLSNFLSEKLQRKIDIVSQRAVRDELKPYINSEIIYL